MATSENERGSVLPRRRFLGAMGAAVSVPPVALEATRRTAFRVDPERFINLEIIDFVELDGQAPGDPLHKAVTEAVLRPAGFNGPWRLAHHYAGEDANLVRFYTDAEAYPDLPYRQDHVRLFDDEYPDGVLGVVVHAEADARRHPRAHYNDVTWNARVGRERLVSVLDAAGIVYQLPDDDGRYAGADRYA